MENKVAMMGFPFAQCGKSKSLLVRKYEKTVVAGLQVIGNSAATAIYNVQRLR